ncbi:unnamed protein product [Schistosoma curassoni]|nr:unnamed protein product [Schistosoma curassoni]
MLHNHPCSSSWMVCDPLTRRLSSEEKENLKPVILHCESADEVIESIKERTGKQVTAADVKGMKATLSTGCFTRNQVMDMLRQRGEVKEHLENGYATRICFSSSNQIQLYRKYPEVVCIDSTYNTNNKKYSLFQLVVTDNCGRGRTVMFAWTRREKRADVIWILDQFKEIMGDTLLTETFVMDCARCESAAVRMTHGHAAHQLLRYCSRWKLHNTQNFQNYTLTALTRRSEVYISIQRSQRIHKQRIIEKYGERFATEVEKKVDNYYLKILNTNL